MSTPLKLVAIGAALLVVLAGGAVFMGGGAARPTPTPSPSPSPVPLPDAVLEPGTYVAHPYPGNPLTWTITVPAGWTGFQSYAVYTNVPDETGVTLGGPTKLGIPADSCNAAGTAPATSVDDLIASVQARDDWIVSEPVATTVSGYHGKRIDLELPSDVTVCGGDRQNYIVLVEGGSGTWHAQGPSNRFHLWALDVDGTTLTIMRNSFAESRPEWMTQSDEILNSSVITP